MNMTTPIVHRNISAATVSGLENLLSKGAVLKVRNQEIRELRNKITVLSQPIERCLFVPHRRNNIFVSLAETFWVLAGRNDVEWLKTYLPRAVDFSDDGTTWRAGYGPRLRNWNGVDQIERVRALLLEETATRRAAMSLFDPASDFIESKDIPCNNWLHWLIRDGKLHLNIGVRSNDIVWGFSGINSFEWSILHEILAFWLNVLPGDATYFASSFHIYDRHYDMATKAVRDFRGIYCYDFDLNPPKFCTPWADFNANMNIWFELEEVIRKSPHHPPRITDHLSDPLLAGALDMMLLFHRAEAGWTANEIRDELAKRPATDLTAAAYEFFGRKHPTVLQSIPIPSIAGFMDSYLHGRVPDGHLSGSNRLLQRIKALHREKDAAYRNSWKRRGEQISILANIARKVDRLEQHARTSVELASETVFDTAVDLFVYSVKYVLFLLERIDAAAVEMLPANAATPYSDHVSNFDWLVERMPVPPGTNSSTETTALIILTFENLHRSAQNPQLYEDRLRIAIELRDQAFTLVTELFKMEQAP